MKAIQKYVLLFLCLLTFSTPVFSQSSLIDSLIVELRSHKEKDSTRVNLLNDLAYLSFKTDTAKTANYIKESETLSKEIGFKKGTARSLFIKAEEQVFRYNFDEGFKLYSKALLLYEILDDRKGIAASYNGMGVLFYSKGEKNKAIAYFENAINVYQENGYTEDIANIVNYLGRAHSELGNYQEAITYYKKAVLLYEEAENEIGVAYGLNNLGTVYANQSNYPVALEYHNKSLKIAEKNSHNWLMTASLGNIGVIHQYQDDYDKAIACYEKILANPKTTDKKITAIISNNLGLVYKEAKQFKKASEMLTKAISIHKGMNNKFDVASPLNNLGDVYLKQNKYDAAYQYYEQGMEISTEVENQRSLCYSYLGLAKVNLKQNKYDAALTHVSKSKMIADKLELINYQRDGSEILSVIYKNTGKYKKAFESHQEFKTLNDSLFNKENIEKITQLEYEYKYKQALDSASIRELKLSKEVVSVNNDLEKSQRNIFLAIIAFLAIAILLGGIIFFLKWRNIKEKNENILIEQKLLRSQMTPHFIFNSLAVLQGMILNKEEKKSVSYLSKFSKLLRIVLENSRDKVVPLSQELDALDNYMALQNLDADPPYVYSLTIDEHIDESLFKIPPMLIQPFIENAIEHAFGNRKEDKEIAIHLTFQNEKLHCTIKDNGIGIHSRPQKSNRNKKSLATTITSERLDMLAKEFNTAGSMNIEDRKKYNEQGTIVTLVIPYKINNTP